MLKNITQTSRVAENREKFHETSVSSNSAISLPIYDKTDKVLFILSFKKVVISKPVLLVPVRSPKDRKRYIHKYQH